jgi:hypothetical protein
MKPYELRDEEVNRHADDGWFAEQVQQPRRRNQNKRCSGCNGKPDKFEPSETKVASTSSRCRIEEVHTVTVVYRHVDSEFQAWTA